ncbi:MAG TPA: hypothetical protein VFU43_08340 [Streptosporangiaceae bacterium]|nr:hypothetical protein [Streptosporangiaceae bacterium]
MSDTDEVAALAAAWPDWHIFLSRHGQYWCARYRHRIPSGLLLSGRAHPHATVIADGPRQLAIELAKQPTLNERNTRQ